MIIDFKEVGHLRCLSGHQKKLFVEACEQIALRFCSPVYLVGSAIDSLYPNDIDLYVVTNEQTYLRMFTNYNKMTESEEDHLANVKAMQVQQAKIYKKQKDYLMERIKGWDFDVKFQYKKHFIQHLDEQVRMDMVYKELW